MAKIKTEELLLTTEEAVALIKNADGKVRFTFMLKAFLPITDEEDRGFEGVTGVSLSRTQAIEAVRGLLGATLEGRGAKLKVCCKAPTYDGGLSFISIY